MLELSMSFLAAGVAATLVPAIRRSTPRLVEVVLWIGLVGAAVLTVASRTNPKASELTVSVVWGAGQLVTMETRLLLAGVQGWAVAHRFDIARLVVTGTGALVLALAFLESVREARTYPRVRLHDWYVLPRAPIPEAVRDPLAGLNRRLADASLMGLRSVGSAVMTTPVVARLAILAAHLLGPGHLRLVMVKVGLGIELPRPPLELQVATPLAGAGPKPGRGSDARRDQRPRHRRPGAKVPAGTRAVSSAQGAGPRLVREKRNGAAQRRQHRLAS